MNVRRQAVAAFAALAAVAVAAAGCTGSSGGKTGGGAGSAPPPVSGSVRVSDPGTPTTPVGTVSSGASTSSSAAPSTPAPTSASALVTFVRGGTAAAASGYGSSSNTSPTALAANRTGDLTFTSPSGNVTCDLRPAGTATKPQVICAVVDLAQRKPRPASCGLNWAPGIASVTGSDLQVGLCVGGPPLPRYGRTLPYGSTLTLGPLVCRGDPRFVACADTSATAGFLADRTAITALR